MSEVTEKPSNDTALWKQKYLDGVEELERKQRQWQQAEEILRKTISRLTLAADGRDPQLDDQLQKVRAAIRDRVDNAQLSQQIETLSKVLVRLDQPHDSKSDGEPVSRPPAPAEKGGILQRLFGSDRHKQPSQSQPSDSLSVEQVLLDLLDHLEVPEILQDRVMVLRERINAGHIADDWESLLDDLTDLIDALRDQMRDDQEELEEFLSEVSQRLQEMDTHLSGSAESQQQGRESRDTMDAAVRREVEEIGSSVRDAVDLNELKSSVASHLESVLGNMDKFQQSEEARYLENQQAMQAMSEKLKTMEQETETLRDQVVQERNQAMTDVLTGIPNRLAYDQRLQQEVARWKRFATPLVLMVWDVDLFKSVNDTYGHKAGDKVLKKLAMGLKRGIRETDFVARYGGEEFVMLMTGSTVEACLQVADKLRASLGEIGFHFRGKSVVVTASCGLSEYREDDTPEQLFERADKALYEAKEQGRNRCIIG